MSNNPQSTSDPKYIPHWFMFPNGVIDDVVLYLTDPELRCLLFALRHILGWQNKVSDKKAQISFSVFQNGYQTENWSALGTGLSKESIKVAIEGLIKANLLEKVGDPTASGQTYRLIFLAGGEINWKFLHDRYEEKKSKGRIRMSPARTKLKEKQAEASYPIERPIQQDDAVLSNRTEASYPIGTYKDTDQRQTKDTSDQSTIVQIDDSTIQKKSSTKKPTVASSLMNPMKDKIALLFGWSWETMSGPEKGMIQKAARELCLADVTIDEVGLLYADCVKKYDDFTPMALTKKVSEMRKTQTTRPTFEPIGDEFGFQDIIGDWSNGNG